MNNKTLLKHYSQKKKKNFIETTTTGIAKDHGTNEGWAIEGPN